MRGIQPFKRGGSCMSTRGNGMIAHVAKPGNLNDALEKVMLTEDHASPIPEPPAVEAQDPPIEAGADVKPVVRRSKTEKGTDGGILGELTALQRRARENGTPNTLSDCRSPPDSQKAAA